ncbi:hypothetical protein FXB39_03200 [Nocardioides sp. BGMRC 2183]|nr:hypothetical protein FXB39_03200 [Nocardioides sp. BGMRC 2183]
MIAPVPIRDDSDTSDGSTMRRQGRSGEPRSALTRLLGGGVAAALVLCLGTLQSSTAEDYVTSSADLVSDPLEQEFPGVPEGPWGGMWIGPKATGISEVSAARQWVRLPAMFNLAWNMPMVTRRDEDCRRLGDYKKTIDFQAWVYFVSTDPRAPEPFGYVGPFTVRTVAFGSIPVEAEVLLGQPRGADGNIEGYELRQTQGSFCEGRGPHAGPSEVEEHYPPVSVAAPVDLSIVGLKVDGIAVDLFDGCRPATQTMMELTSKDYYSLDPTLRPEDHPRTGNTMTTPFFAAPIGGLLTASIDIAPFAGCRTRSGEDLSPLLTATVSGEQNGVALRSEGLKSGGVGCARDRSQCTNPLPSLPLPSGPTGGVGTTSPDVETRRR